MARQVVPEAEREASELLDRWDIEKPPVPVEEIAAWEGIEIRSEPLGDEVSAMLVLASEKPVAVINSSHHRHRRRFSLAHEIGHYILHRDQEGLFVEYRDDRSAMAIDPREIGANAFAAALLMPPGFLVKDLNSKRYKPLDATAVSNLAKRYKVSEQAMRYRLVNLGIVPGFED